MWIDDDGALDVVVRGGRVLDPGRGVDARLDVGIRYGHIAALAPDLGERIARPRTEMPIDAGTLVIDATDRIVTPGFIDLHTHTYTGVCVLTVPADETSSVAGVTTAVNAGDPGAHTIEGFRRLVVEPSRTRVLAFLNVSSAGMATWPAGEAKDLDLLDVPAAVRAAREHPDIVVGVKVRMSAPSIIGEHDLEPLRRAMAIGERADIPVMMHIGLGPRPIGQLLELLRPGDIVTHCWSGMDRTLVEDGRVAPGVHAARARGVLFDLGHGLGSFSYATASVAIAEDLWPDTISTDLHSLSAGRPPLVDLPTTMSKLLDLGMTLETVIRAVTSSAAKAIGRASTLGAIELGRSADLVVLSVDEGPMEFVDQGVDWGATRQTRVGARRIRVHETIRAGIPWQGARPHPGRGVGVAPDPTH